MELAHGGSGGLYDVIKFKLGPIICIGKDPSQLYPSQMSDTDYYFKYNAKYDAPCENISLTIV